MRKKITTLLLLCAITAYAQTQHMQVTMNDGSLLSIPTDSIVGVTFEQMAPPSLEGLVGQWRLIAMPNGSSSGGIYTATADTIQFTASLTAPDSDDYGRVLRCHADRFYWRSGHTYPADWLILVEQNEQNATRRIGWVLNAEQPASTTEFQESQDKYLEDGFFYWGNADNTGHRYIYLLSENIATQRLEGITLWSSWLPTSQTTFTFPQNQEVYGVVAEKIPYSQSVGYFEIWASPRFERLQPNNSK